MPRYIKLFKEKQFHVIGSLLISSDDLFCLLADCLLENRGTRISSRDVSTAIYSLGVNYVPILADVLKEIR